MIGRSGKLFINGSLQPRRYDRNEAYGVDYQVVRFFEIVREVFLGRWKLTLSRSRELRHGDDFMTLGFDPPEIIGKQ